MPSAYASQAIFIKPTEGQLSSSFGSRNGNMHFGIDFAASTGTPVKAAAAGTVSRSYLSQSYGNAVFIRHTINGQVWETVYAHMSSRAVTEGQYVKAGQLIGKVGSTGDSTGSHLHFETHKGTWNIDKSNAVNPLDYMGTTVTTAAAAKPQSNPVDGSWGTVKVKFPAGYGVNVYATPGGAYKGRVLGGHAYKVYAKKGNWFNIGSRTWIKADYVTFTQDTGYVDYPAGYKVNVYRSPNGSFKERVNGQMYFKVYGYKNGFYDIGQSRWIPASHVVVIRH